MVEEKEFLCRLCLNLVPNSYNIFENNNSDNILIKDIIIKLFHIEINKNDELTNEICLKCYEIIDSFYQFYCLVLKNDTKLKKNFQKISYDIQILLNSTLADDILSEENDNNIKDDRNDIIYKEQKNGLEKTANFPQNTDENQENYEETQIELNENEINDLKTNIIDIPEHLKQRISKTKSDAQIKQFLDIVCTICGRDFGQFNTFKEMQIHYQEKHNIRGYLICCGKKIYRKDRLMDHITNHINPDAFKCPECGQSSKSKVLLRIHMKQHLPVDQWPFKCNKCEQRFVLRSQLKNHEASHLSECEKKYVCDECGKAFALKFVLIKHKLIHTKEKHYFCEICAKSFSCRGNLSSHIKQHGNEKSDIRVQCPDCGKWYKNIQTLRTHLNRHRDKREHICNECGKKCSTKSSLSAHIKYVHMKITEYECNICAKQFRRKPELTEHMARHTGEILYKCQYCEKTFFSSSNFFAHRKNRHPKEYAKLMKQQKQGEV